MTKAKAPIVVNSVPAEMIDQDFSGFVWFEGVLAKIEPYLAKGRKMLKLNTLLKPFKLGWDFIMNRMTGLQLITIAIVISLVIGVAVAAIAGVKIGG
jgi:hypothetical protein